MPEPYPGLSPAQQQLGRALTTNRRWRGRVGLCALRADGSVVELRTANPWPKGGLLLFSDEVCLGHLLELLVEAAGSLVSHELGVRRGRSYCTLRAPGGHERTFYGETMGEVVGAALAARWAALDRPAGR